MLEFIVKYCIDKGYSPLMARKLFDAVDGDESASLNLVADMIWQE